MVVKVYLEKLFPLKKPYLVGADELFFLHFFFKILLNIKYLKTNVENNPLD